MPSSEYGAIITLYIVTPTVQKGCINMGDLKTYIQEHLKRCCGLDMSKLLEACGMSRAKFYKCLKEPWRFDDSALERIAQELQLGEQERKGLLEFKYGSAVPVLPSEKTIQTSENERENLYPLVERILFGECKIPTDHRRKVFSFFHEASSGQKNGFYSAEEFAKYIIDDIDQIKTDEEPPINITIFNSRADGAIDVVFSLLQSLKEHEQIEKIDAISMSHFIGKDDVSLEEKLGIYADWNGLMRHGRYELLFTNPYKGSMFESWNGMLIRYPDRTKVTKYLMMSIYSSDDAAVYSFSDNNLFEFLRCSVADLFWPEDSQSLLSTNALEVSKRLVQKRALYPTIAFGEGICLDHILPALYDEKICEFTNENSTWTGYEDLLKATKAQSLSDLYGKKPTIKMLFEGFKQRFFVGEKAGMVNLLSASGLKKFAHTGRNIDMDLIDTGFSQEQIIRELNYLKTHLDGASGGQSYYLINSPMVPHCKIMHIIKGDRVAMVFPETVAPATYLKSQLDWDTMDIFYDYVMNRLLSEESRSRPDSPVMSKARAEDFIDGLIEYVEGADPAKYKQ